MSYTPIHVHSCYSIRDAIVRLEPLAAKCAEYKIEACAITDHGFSGAAYKQVKAFKEHNIKPLIGCEFYYAGEDAKEKGPNYHLLIMAKNNEGYKNICSLNKYAYVDGFYRKPRIDKAALYRFREGLIVSTACMFGHIQQMILNNEMDAAMAEISWFQDTFGEDFYLEIADHGMEEEDIIRKAFREIGLDKGIKCLPATDTHYLNKEDKKIHNIFKQLAYNTVGKDDDGFDGTGYHVHNTAEMLAKFTKQELDNSLEVADKCNVDFKFTGYNLPNADLPIGMDSFEYLYSLALKGLEARGLQTNPVYVERVRFEMEQLHLTDLEDYFIIVYDYIKWCKEQKIPVGPGRGSAAGSLVSWLIGITGVDPIKYDLLFARCINPGRALQYKFL